MRRYRPKRRRSQARRKRVFRLTVPVIWGRVGSAVYEEPRILHAVSWRSKLRALITALFSSPRWASLSILVGITAVFYRAGVDQTYQVSAVEVAGATTLSREAVAEASGLEGMHVFWLDPVEAAARVAETPSVLTATVEIGWPNRVHITVVERAPVMVWDQAGDRFWVDRKGRLMQARHDSTGLLIILSQEPETLSVGERVPVAVMASALQLREERPNVVSLYYERHNGLSYQDGRNWRVYFGTGWDMNQKLTVYEALVDDLLARGEQPKYISVVNKEKPFYRLLGSMD